MLTLHVACPSRVLAMLAALLVVTFLPLNLADTGVWWFGFVTFFWPAVDVHINPAADG